MAVGPPRAGICLDTGILCKGSVTALSCKGAAFSTKQATDGAGRYVLRTAELEVTWAPSQPTQRPRYICSTLDGITQFYLGELC